MAWANSELVQQDGAFLRNEREGVRDAELLFLGDGGAPDGDRDDLFEPATFFAASEGTIFGRDTIDEVEGAAECAEYAQKLGGESPLPNRMEVKG